MLNCFGIDKLHGFMMHSVMLAVGHILHQNDYSFQFSNVGSYVSYVKEGVVKGWLWGSGSHTNTVVAPFQWEWGLGALP